MTHEHPCLYPCPICLSVDIAAIRSAERWAVSKRIEELAELEERTGRASVGWALRRIIRDLVSFGEKDDVGYGPVAESLGGRLMRSDSDNVVKGGT